MTGISHTFAGGLDYEPPRQGHHEPPALKRQLGTVAHLDFECKASECSLGERYSNVIKRVTNGAPVYTDSQRHG
ncbi:hypothetical protein CLCR_03228 [Cladophialophora carrionii]|uniref:Uncharacterized protein n=1 Tax=Cladophialophora carrionii TaxID=86049 RepID=A0A1C1D2Y1_9EURO|nr:hypothetical protein CLCR_03228 [Cladophialophora carrionii]